MNNDNKELLTEIGKLIDSKLDTVYDKLDSMIDVKLEPITNRLDKVDDRLDKIDDRLDKMDDRFDKMDIRFDKIDDRLDKVEELAVSTHLTMVRFENDMTQKIELLLEGHAAIIDKLAPISRVEALEDEVTVMKIAIRQLNEDIQQLKKAQ